MLALRFPLVLLLATIAAFGASLSSGWVFDDYAILSDPSIASAAGWKEFWGLTQTRPLTYLSFWFDYRLWGAQPAGFHATSLILHLACVLAVWRGLSALLPLSSARVATALFAIHPIQSQAVLYVFARSTLLATFFCTLSLLLWVRGRHWWSCMWFGIALLAKEECIGWPLFLLLLHFSISRNRAEWKPLAAMFGLSIAAGLRLLFAAAVTPGSAAGPGAGISPIDYLATQGLVIWRYLALLVWPHGYTIDPEIVIGGYWWAWLGLLALTAVAARRFRRASEGFWWLGAMALLLPSSSIFPLADLSAERRMYLPMFALSPLLALGLARLHPAVSIVVLAVCLVVSADRTQVWRSEERIWREALRRAPNKVRPKIQLARLTSPAESLSLLQEAARLAPEDALVASELGRLHLTQGRPAEALGEFGRALALAPQSASAHANRGVAHLFLGQKDAAIADLRRALDRDPCSFEARYNLKRLGLATIEPSGCRYTPGERQLLDDPASGRP